MNSFVRFYYILMLIDFIYFINGDINCYLANSQKYNQLLLKQSNFYRSLHSSPPLTLDTELIDEATDWSRHLAEIGKLKHSSGKKYGENLFMSRDSEGFDVKNTNVIKSWYDEVKDYESGVSSSATGHFTQLIWKNTKKMGCGICTADNKQDTYITCRYTSPGNIVGEYEQNVLPIKGIPKLSKKKKDDDDSDDSDKGKDDDDSDDSDKSKDDSDDDDDDDNVKKKKSDDDSDESDDDRGKKYDQDRSDNDGGARRPGQRDRDEYFPGDPFLQRVQSVVKFLLYITLIITIAPIVLLIMVLVKN